MRQAKLSESEEETEAICQAAAALPCEPAPQPEQTASLRSLECILSASLDWSCCPGGAAVVDGSRTQLCLGTETVAVHTAGGDLSSMPVQIVSKLPIKQKPSIAQQIPVLLPLTETTPMREKTECQSLYQGRLVKAMPTLEEPSHCGPKSGRSSAENGP